MWGVQVQQRTAAGQLIFTQVIYATLYHRSIVGEMEFGYFDDTCPLPSLMVPPYHIFVRLPLPIVPPCIPGLGNGRQVIREQDMKTGWDTMAQSGAGNRNFRLLGIPQIRRNLNLGKYGMGLEKFCSILPKRDTGFPSAVPSLSDSCTRSSCNHSIRPARFDGSGSIVVSHQYVPGF